MDKFKFKIKNKVSFEDYQVYLVNEGKGIGFASKYANIEDGSFVLFGDGSFGFHSMNQFDLTPIEVTKVTYKEKA